MEVVSTEEGRTAEPIDGVTLTIGAGGERTNAQHFEIDPGAEVPVHSHENEQVGEVFAGTLTFVLEDGELEVGPGDTYAIPPDEPHGARNDGDEPVVGVETFTPARPNPSWAPEE